MADAPISFAVEKLGNALINKVKFLKGVKGQIEWLENELKGINCFLEDAGEKQGNDESGKRIRKWVSDVREVAQDIEDAIDIFILKLDKPTTWRDQVRRWIGFPIHVTRLNKLGKEIESIRTRLDEIERRRKRYGIREVGKGSSSRSSRSEMVELRRQIAARFQKDKDVVGLAEDTDLLLNKVILDEKSNRLSLTAIVGMGGIGKSTLARKIYKHPAIAARFEQRAWVVVSNQFETEDILKEIMQQLPFSLDPDDEVVADESRYQEMLKEMRSKHEERLKGVESVKDKGRRQIALQEILRDRLEGKRYFIVLDDVWEHQHWELLRNAFPDEQGITSRLLFTSREEIFTKHHGYIHKMRVLNPDESWELLLKKVFIGRSEGTRCPEVLEDIGRKILTKCHGLPLAITVIGGMLVDHEESTSGWDSVLKQITNYHAESNEFGKEVSPVLELSYHNLPSQLKHCFLCLAFFPEDAVIRAKRLIHIWVALGFVQVQGDGEETVEERGSCFLDELIKRNLVEVKEMTIDDKVKYCHVHDLLRKLSINKAKEEIGFESLSSEDHEGSSSSSTTSSKPRHHVLRVFQEGFTHVMNLMMPNQREHLRSLFLHVEDSIGYLVISPSFWKGFELLRILDIEGSQLQKLPSTVRALIGIRYLRLKEEGELTLPSWLDALINLEVVDIAECERVIFPDVTWKMNRLRHFYINSKSNRFSDSMKKYSWANLETVKYMRSDEVLYTIQGAGGRLRKLGIQVIAGNEEAETILERLSVESALQVLHLRWGIRRQGNFPIPTFLVHLTKLKLHGRMDRCPSANMFPQNITHLTISKAGMIIDPMPELSKIPNLLFLKLDNAISGMVNTMNASHEGFPKLKLLHLTSLPWLDSIEIEEGGMPQLQRLHIYECPRISPYVEKLGERIRPAEIIIIVH